MSQPDENPAASALREILTADISRFDAESSKHKRIHRRTELAVIASTALTTITAGLGLILDGREREIQFAVLILSTLSAAIVSWAASRRARELWQHEREVYYSLKDILRELEFRHSATVLQTADVQEMFKRSTSVLGSSSAEWSRILEAKIPNSGTT
jgi:hypothetical protein